MWHFMIGLKFLPPTNTPRDLIMSTILSVESGQFSTDFML